LRWEYTTIFRKATGSVVTLIRCLRRVVVTLGGGLLRVVVMLIC
jgi:hypothetical protein